MQNSPNLADFPNHCFEDVRFGDIDMLGHVNNAVYATYFESARVKMLIESRTILASQGGVMVLARLTIDFLKELNWPNRICVATGVERIGQSSATLRHAIFVGDTCIATAESILVLIDVNTRKSTPLPQVVRDEMEAFLLALPA